MSARPCLAWDGDAVRALLRLLYEQHERGDNLGCHSTALQLDKRLALLHLILPQHQLWSINVYRKCDFRCEYCSVWAQGSARPVLEGDALRERLRLELGVVPPDHHTVLSSQSDAYVPGEERLGLARITIEELIDAGRCVHVVTKGQAVLRDADLIRRARCGKVEISLSTLDRDVAAEIEPGASEPVARLALVRELAAAGVDVGISLAPWIPDVTDVSAVVAAAGLGCRITVSPLKCNGHGAEVRVAGRLYSQQLVNRRYCEERARFGTHPSIKWEPPWRFGDHYLSRYQPLTLVAPRDSPFRLDPVPTIADRVLRRLAESGFWQRAGRLHARLHHLSAGRIGRSIGGLPILLLTTTGRLSGLPRTVPLAYVVDGGRWTVVAANGGSDRHPAWWLNLRAGRRGTVLVDGIATPVKAREATRAERLRLWGRLLAAHPFARRCEQMTARQMPLVILAPVR